MERTGSDMRGDEREDGKSVVESSADFVYTFEGMLW